MKNFDVIRLIIVTIPTGMFTTYLFFIAIVYTLKVKKVDEIARRLMTVYSLLAGASGVMLPVFYFMPDIFARWSILYCALATYTMIVYYHFLYYAARLKKVFSLLHYLFPALACAGLLVCSKLFPQMWAEQGVDISLSVTLICCAVYALLPIHEMYKFQLMLAIESGTVAAIDKYSAIPFVCELLLYPTVTVLFPLIWGTNPGIFVSVVLMGCLLLALTMNIPLTYALIRQYTGQWLSDDSLFETSMGRTVPAITRTVQKAENKAQEKQPASQPQSNPSKRKGTSKIDKKTFQDYFRKHKPYLNPNLTIYDLVEPLSSNRTYISEFINRVYGMSFSSYVNRCRFQELERLRALPSNKDKSEAMLAAKAGFGKYRNYLYVKKQFSQKPEQPLNSQTKE